MSSPCVEKLAPSSCVCPLPCSCSRANVIADLLGVSPMYHQEDTARWNSAACLYQAMNDQVSKSHLQQPTGDRRVRSAYHSPERDSDRPTLLGIGGSMHNLTSLPLSLHKVSSINRSFAGTNPGSRGESSLELEAIAAVHELSFAVQSISVSEMLPRTSDLIFVNLTTIEEQPFCLELTHKGWRITSLRLDCMVGDFTRLELFTKYYDSLFSLMDTISPGYRARFGEKLALRLKMLENGDESGIAPCGSYASPSLSRGSSQSSFESLPDVTPTNTPAVKFSAKMNALKC
ncbi:unnamed protein product [Cylicocyclus nassatus]|uniref:GSKIP domain-containing protein n=1 Tax=Cylicocyclus nassatus TaxID=53992 RepID=A0AA36GK85_CYLNA|nr:unnamed protein product [Cylicocyclus nassatus]